MARFQPGQSGNPAGKKKGTVNATTALIRSACPEILNAMVAKAIDGDTQAAALILNRGIPNLRPTLERVELLTPEQIAEMSPAAKAEAVNAAALTGRCPPDIASQLLAGIRAQCEIVTASEVLERIEQLEGEIKANADQRGVTRL